MLYYSVKKKIIMLLQIIWKFDTSD